jgi:mRNA interferase MazF
MVVRQGDVFWAEMPDPVGSSPGYRRPVVVIQGNELNRSSLRTVLCAPLTSQTKWAQAPGNVFLTSSSTGLPRDSVVVVSQLVALDRSQLIEQVGSVSGEQLFLVLQGIDIVLGRG